MEAQEPAPIRIGIPAARLKSASPRGVVRTARAVAEQFAAASRLSFYALSEPFYNNHEVIFEAWELGPWLNEHPMIEGWPGAAAHGARVSPGSRGRAAAFAKAAVTALGLEQPARLALRAGRFLRGRIATAVKRIAAAIAPSALAPNNAPAGSRENAGYGLPSAYFSLDDLDLLLSFECYDAIWDWPTELFKCRMVGVFHDAIPFRINEGAPKSAERYFVAAGKMVQRAHWIVCDSHATLQDLHAFFPSSKPKSCVIHLGHDRERFLAAARPAFLRPHFGPANAKQTGKTIVMIGEMEPRKNQAGVLRACRLLAAEFPAERITLTLIGELPSGYPRQLLQQQIPANINIDCCGYVSDEELRLLLQNSDVFVFASLREGFGIPVLEAMSAGVPVVCSQNSSLTEVGGPWAFYCDPYDPTSIADAIKLAWNLTPSQRESWVAKGRAWAEQFTWERCAREFEQICYQAASRPARGEAWPEPPECESSLSNHPSWKGENRRLCQAS